jgi:peptidoglycan/xylan/chitin deacetylase (PgdA/CDA1 family)
MIGVSAAPEEHEAAEEFFQLCKTPWEFARADKAYDVVIATNEVPSSVRSGLVLRFDPSIGQSRRSARSEVTQGTFLKYGARRLPIYGPAATFPDSKPNILADDVTGASVTLEHGSSPYITIGYNLFIEVRFLLTQGQPVQNADIPALELHICILRDLITRSGHPFVEIPAVPAGYKFIACLTHDVDHPILRNHRFDHTMIGFVYRATIGTLLDVVRKGKPASTLLRNGIATALLPLVHLGIVRDLWRKFDRYLEIEQGMRSTFFVIARGGYPGRRQEGSAPAKRACRYRLEEIAPELQRITSCGHEIGLHGLDAWLDPQSGREESARLSAAVGPTKGGVRMHWLYFAPESSPRALDEAGFSYDSSFGYNQTIGYRAGTAQAFRPLGATNLIELPLHVMDTALFYPSYLNLSEGDALQRTLRIFDHVNEMGGAVTINWHDRSIAAERLWEAFYRKLLQELTARRAWCPIAAQAVAWFRKRRSVKIDYRRRPDGSLEVSASDLTSDELPELLLRVHSPRNRTSPAMAEHSGFEFVDLPLTRFSVVQIPART